MSGPDAFRCPCGAAAPSDLPAPGRPPVRCAACATPLVAPGRIESAAFERGLGAALLVAVLGAAGWAAICHYARTGAPWSLAVAGLAVGLAARTAARARGGRVQLAAGIALVVFFLLGEFLAYRHALLPRLEAMHAAEGAPDASLLAETERERIYEEVNVRAGLDQLRRGHPLDAIEAVWPGRYVSIEATRDLFLAMAAGVALAMWLTRARPAVAAFSQPSRGAPVGSAPPADVTASSTSSPPSESTPRASPASDGSDPASSAPPDAT